MSGARKPFGRLGLHVGEDSRVDCSTYVARSPILDIRAGNVSVAISLLGDEIDQTAVSFARNLVDQARLFAAEVERLHALETDARKRDQAEQAA
jgi:hypothetical protein